MSRPPLQGHVKFFKPHSGYGFLVAPSVQGDVYFRARVIEGREPICRDDLVAFLYETGADGRPIATRVKLVTPARTLDGRQPYFGKPTKIKDEIVEALRTSEFVGGLAGAILLGPFGIIGVGIGMLLGSGVARSIAESEGEEKPPPIVKKGDLLTQTCLRCASVMHVSSITAERVGYQCIQCGRLFTLKNEAGLKPEHVELALPEFGDTPSTGP